MKQDFYKDFAERYDWMKMKDHVRDEFFKKLFEKHNVTTVLDCACGTGHDLILFHSLGCEVRGSDISDSMLSQARKNLADVDLEIPLDKADFGDLGRHFRSQFDAVVCLTNAINEPLGDDETLKALTSIRTVLKDGGILVFDQGQTDAGMKNPPRYDLIVNERDYSRLFVMDYLESQMDVHIFDIIHTEDERDFRHNLIRLQIRLKDDWESILKEAGFTKTEYFGDWQFTPYDKEQSKRFIAVAYK